VDADNTLWDTDGVFARAQLNMLRSVEAATAVETSVSDRLALIRHVDQALAERHHLGLRYPPRLLASALARVLSGEEPEAAAKTVWKGGAGSEFLSLDQLSKIEEAFITDTRRLPDLLPGVRDGLARLHASGALIVIVTEGARSRVMRAANEHNLAALFDRIVEGPKTVRLFERVQKLGRSSQPVFMIGDQMKKDIVPASAAGLMTIYVPGRFQPRWESAEAVNGPTFRASRFDDAVDFILGRH
jgi:putative hydrolase of the HAD superfamily